RTARQDHRAPSASAIPGRTTSKTTRRPPAPAQLRPGPRRRSRASSSKRTNDGQHRGSLPPALSKIISAVALSMAVYQARSVLNRGTDRNLSPARVALGGALQQHGAFGDVPGERCGAAELLSRLTVPAEPRQQVT